MSAPLMIMLIAVIVNLVGTLVLYSFTAFFIARLHWHGHGIPAVLITIIMAEVFWIVPALIGFGYPPMETPASDSLWFGNWLVSTFAVVLFCQTVKGIPRQLEDSARLDGCGRFGIYWYTVLPLVRRELGFIAFLTVMATALPFCINFTRSGAFPFVRLPTGDLFAMLAVSAIASLPVIAIFFIAIRRSEERRVGK